MTRHYEGRRAKSRALSLRRTSQLLLAVVAIAGVACNGDDDDTSTAGTATTASAKATNLRQDPALVRPSTPGRAILDQWRYMKLGAVPLAFSSYATKARIEVGNADLAGMIAEQELNLADLRPVVTAEENTAFGPLITLKAVGTDGRVLTYTYLMRREGRLWRVAYDTLTHSALRTYVTNRVQNATKPGADPSARAREAGAKAAERYRLSALR